MRWHQFLTAWIIIFVSLAAGASLAGYSLLAACLAGLGGSALARLVYDSHR